MADKFNLVGFSVDTDNNLALDGNIVSGGTISGEALYGVATGPTNTYSSDGDIDINISVAKVTGLLQVVALGLPDGTSGQRLTIKCVNATNNIVVTPTNFFDGSTITFDLSGEYADLVFVDGEWLSIGTDATIA